MKKCQRGEGGKRNQPRGEGRGQRGEGRREKGGGEGRGEM